MTFSGLVIWAWDHASVRMGCIGAMAAYAAAEQRLGARFRAHLGLHSGALSGEEESPGTVSASPLPDVISM